MNKRNIKNTEWSILICVILLLIIGLVALYSASINSDLQAFKKQCIFVLISIPILIFVTYVDYSVISRFSPYLYGLSIILLIAVLFTASINGASSWFDIGFFAFQPAELAKVFVIMFLSVTIVNIQKQSRKEINRISKIGIIIGIVLLPVLLIIMQPDYGTAIAYIISLILILYVAGIDKKYIIISFLILLVTVPLLYFFVLPAHAKTRIDVFLNPNLDPRGSGYNVLQSKLAIGSGQFFGMGIKNGSQTQLGYLYPQTTDFIYSAIGEEMGFVVAAAVIVLYILLITRAIKIAKTAKDDLGSYIASGIAGIFIFHMVENIGMTMGLLPITGVPLPFVSYGGSSLLTNCILIGLLLNISGRRNKVMFFVKSKRHSLGSNINDILLVELSLLKNCKIDE